MNTSWLSLLGGGVAASATLAAGITVSGIADVPAAPDKVVYVEQPVLIVPGAPETLPGPVRDQLIAILPVPQVAAVDPAAPAADPAAPSTDPAPIALPAPVGGEDEDDEDGEYEDGEHEDGEHEGGEGEDD
jgi:hypothetical protein